MSDQKNQNPAKGGLETPSQDKRKSRRRTLAALGTGGVAALVKSNDTWVKPVVDSVILPSHAQTSLASLLCSIRIDEPDLGNGANASFPILYNQAGDYTVDGWTDDLPNSIDDPSHTFVGQVLPAAAVPVTMSFSVGDNDASSELDNYPSGQTIVTDPTTGIATFQNLTYDSVSSTDDIEISVTFSAPGFPDKTINMNFNAAYT